MTDFLFFFSKFTVECSLCPICLGSRLCSVIQFRMQYFYLNQYLFLFILNCDFCFFHRFFPIYFKLLIIQLDYLLIFCFLYVCIGCGFFFSFLLQSGIRVLIFAFLASSRCLFSESISPPLSHSLNHSRPLAHF